MTLGKRTSVGGTSKCHGRGGRPCPLIREEHPDAVLIRYLAYEEDKVEAVLENPKLLRTPIVRNGRAATVGYAPETWKTWE